MKFELLLALLREQSDTNDENEEQGTTVLVLEFFLIVVIVFKTLLFPSVATEFFETVKHVETFVFHDMTHLKSAAAAVL
jgi:hypothetical protein